MRWVLMSALALGLLIGAGCSDEDASGPGSTSGPTSTSGPGSTSAAQRFPDVVEVEVTRAGDAYDFAVTISSPYDTPERYADGWRILAPDGAVLGEMTLGHDHADEQPFTRSQTGLAVPDGVAEVTVEGRDLANGYGGARRTVSLPAPGR